MAEEDTPAAPAIDYSQLPALMEKLGLTPPAPPQLPSSPGQGGVAGFLGDVGKALAGGGSGLLDLPPGESDKAGAHALLNAGINMLMASGPSYVPRGLGEIIGYGLQGAQQGYQGSELAVADRLAAQQAGQQQQFANRMEAIKAALPLLRLQQVAGVPNPLLAGGGGKSGTSIADYVDPVTAMPREKALDAIAQRESGGKNIPNAEGGDASGYWQIRDATWQDGAKLAGVDVSKYPRAIDAPQAVQRQVAGAIYDKYGATPWAASAPGRTTQTAAPPPTASGGGTAAPAPGRVQVAAATPTTATDGTTAAPAAPAPAGDTTAPPAAAPTKLSFEDFQKQHPIPIDPGSYTVTPPNLADLQAAQKTAAQQLSLARASGDAAGTNKSISDYNTATKAIADAQAAATAKTAELRQAALKNALDTQRQLYDAEQQRLQQDRQKELDRQAAAALETQRGQQQENIERIKAGQTFHMQQEEEAAKQTNTNIIAPMSAQAIKAHELNLGLSQLQTVLPNLPKGGGTVGYLLDHHPDLLPLLNQAGVVTDRQADATRLLTGLTSGLSTAMKPTGLGALREYEFDAFKAQLPNLLSTPEGQQKALAYLMNLNDRVQKEAQWTQQHYNRRIPDEMSQKPGATRRALNLDTDEGVPWQQKMDRELGPLVPSYTPPQGQAPSASGQAAWEASLPPGKPFYRTYRDGTSSLEFKPWR